MVLLGGQVSVTLRIDNATKPSFFDSSFSLVSIQTTGDPESPCDEKITFKYTPLT